MHTQLLGLISHLDQFHRKVLQQAIRQINNSKSLEINSTYHSERTIGSIEKPAIIEKERLTSHATLLELCCKMAMTSRVD